MNWKDFQKWFEVQAASGVDYIVRIMLKHEHEYKYRTVTALLLGHDHISIHSWNKNWHEGEPDIIVISCVPVDNELNVPIGFRVY